MAKKDAANEAPKATPKPPKFIDHKKDSIVRAVALLREAQQKMACDPPAAAVLLNQAVEELTT